MKPRAPLFTPCFLSFTRGPGGQRRVVSLVSLVAGLMTATGCGDGASDGEAPASGGTNVATGGGTSSGGNATTGGGSATGGAASGGEGGSATGGAASGGTGSGGLAADGGTSGSGGGGTTSSGGESGGDPTPPVKDVEDSGTDCPDPTLPDFGSLMSIESLPDPFEMTDGTRIERKSEWTCRRAEIKKEIERYGAGEKPGKPSQFEATLDGNTLNIVVGEGGNSFTMRAPINRPNGADSGPIPAIIGVNTPTGSLPGDVFGSRGIATITYSANEVASTSFSGPARNSGNFYSLYPGTTAGYMVRWAWGISRIIDALEELPEANIDVSRLAVSGCSYQGKIALYAGAFDERIALTIPHESGGGGTISWRYSDMLEDRDNTEVENLHHAQGAPWYAEALMQFNNAPDKLPYDHHELIAMVAPRAFLAIESTAIARMGAEAARVDALGARKVWDALGVSDRMGASEENVNHCVWHEGFRPDLEAYVDKFLLGKEDVDTDILRSRFQIDEATWIPWDAPTLE